MIAFTNKTLNECIDVQEGTEIPCRCGQTHKLEAGTEKTPEGIVKSTLLLFYRCQDSVYLGAVNGKFVAGIKPDIAHDKY
jgi:hypothetical protein